jgi:hypothetical protein
MANAVTIYQGSLVMLNSSGLAVAAANGAGNKGVVGVATKKVVGTGATDYVEVQEGWFKFAGATLAQSCVGSLAYAKDDQTVDETQAANDPVAGMFVEYIGASEAWVAVGPQFLT